MHCLPGLRVFGLRVKITLSLGEGVGITCNYVCLLFGSVSGSVPKYVSYELEPSSLQLPIACI